MVVIGTTTFLLGMICSLTPTDAMIPSVGTEIVIAKDKSLNEELIEYPAPSPGDSSFISNFIQTGTNIFIKPHFKLSSAQVQPTHEALMFEKGIKTPILPALPRPEVVIEETMKPNPGNNLESTFSEEIMAIHPSLVPNSETLVTLPVAPFVVNEIQGLTGLPKVPLLSTMEMHEKIDAIPLAVPISSEPLLSIPISSVLPQLTLPELPAPIIFEAHEKEVPIPILTEETAAPTVISERPVFPTFSIELPAPVVVETQEKEASSQETEVPMVIPGVPVFPSFSMELPAPVVIETQETEAPTLALYEETAAPEVIPETPVLPTFPIELPAPVVIETQEKEAPTQVISEETEVPVVIPEAPAIPSFSIELPAPNVIETQETETPTPALSEEIAAPEVISETPIFPTFSIELPAPVVIETQKTEAPIPTFSEESAAPVVIPEAPMLPTFSSPEVILPVPIEVDEKLQSNPLESFPSLSLPLPLLNPVVSENFQENENKDTNKIEKPLIFSANPFLAPLEFATLGYPVMPFPNAYRPEQILSSPYRPPIQSTFTPQNMETVDKIIIPNMQGETRITIPAACAQNIIMERVLPNLSGQHEIQLTPALPVYPVPLPYLPTVGFRPF